jgi:hypothetical protein
MKILFVLSIILFACQSQADKDRSKMQELIQLRESLKKESNQFSNELEKNRTRIYNEVELEIKLMDSTGAVGSRDSLAFLEGRLARTKMDIYLIPIKRVNDSINIINSQINDLKLLMGK